MQKPNYRISEAALGRHLANAISLAKEGEIAPEKFLATITAVYESCLSEEFTPDSDADIDMEAYEKLRAGVEKSARRSESARQAAERRRMAKARSSVQVSELLGMTDMIRHSKESEHHPVASENLCDSHSRRRKKNRKKRKNRR